MRTSGWAWMMGAALLGGAAGAQAAPVDAGVSHALAISRAARVSGLHYAIDFRLAEHASTVAGRETIAFDDTGSGDLALDYRDGALAKAELNGVAIGTTLENGHLMLPGTGLHRGENTLTLEFTSNAAAAGKAITRYEDKDDGSEYLYTLFVPMDASMAFPCFDQPDLKARFTLRVQAPAAWTVIGNTAPEHSGTEWKFAETRPISTYLFAFAAGPFARLPGSAAGEPTMYVRKSQLARAKVEAPQVQQMAARGLKYFSDTFAQPYPFPKYELVLIPGFPFGGMEHAGETFLNEDGVLFRTAPTQNDYFKRNILVLHETCHQWFGDFVTMRWFDDLWLKEGFAQYMAYKALAELEPAQNPWKHFYEEIKPLAYGIDETQGTTPISQDIPNLKDAKSAYGAIVYQKAPAVLKELNYFVGDETFRDGLRLYLKQHAYGNAQWSDLVAALESAGDARGQHRDVQGWAKAWILQRGMPQVTVEYACASDKIASLTLHQKDVLGQGFLWPLSNEVALIGADGRVETVKASWGTAAYPVKEAVGKACPALVFANEGDYGYGRFLLDAKSAAEAAVVFDPESAGVNPALRESMTDAASPLRRTMLWGALWDNVHIAEAPPRGYVELALKSLPTEQDESLAGIQGSRVATALHLYMTAETRGAYLPTIEAISVDRMLHQPTLGLRIVSFRTFTSVAETPHALEQMKSLLHGSLAIPDMPLKPLDRWTLIGHLLMLNDPDAATLFASEKARDTSGEGQKYAYAMQAAAPDAAVKARYFNDYLHSPNRQEDWITQSLGWFNSWNQADLTAPYLDPALNALKSIKQHRKIFFLGVWLRTFLDGQHSAASQQVVDAWLARAAIDRDLRLKVLEAKDDLDRTVMIRAKYPD
jgi:aminopeptidase N